MCPLNIRFLPPPAPFQRPTTLARASSTSCQVTSRPIFWSADCMYCAICNSSPVGLGMLMTSEHMETISSSRTSARMRSTRLGSSVGAGLVFVCTVVVSHSSLVVRYSLHRCWRDAGATLRQAKIVRVSAHLFVAPVRYKKIIFKTKPAAAGPINSGLDRQYHPSLYCPRPRLMRVGRFMCPCSYSVTDRMRGLPGVSAFGNAGANQLVEIGEARPSARESDAFVKNFEKKIEQLVVFARQFTGTGVLRKVGPIAVGTHPYLEQRRLVFLDGTVAGGGKG